VVNYFRLYFGFFVLKSLTGALLITSYLTDGTLDLTYLFKIPLVGMFVVAVLFHLRGPIRSGLVGRIIAIGGFVATIRFLLNGERDMAAALSHVYSALMAVFAVSFGHAFALNHERTGGVFYRAFIALFVVQAVILSGYMYFYYVAGKISYFGFDSDLPLVAALALGRNNLPWYIAILAIILFSGKRSPMVSAILPMLLLLLSRSRGRQIATKVAVGLTVMICAAGLYRAYDAGLLWRFESMLQNLQLDDEEKMYLATSGRSVEFIGIYEYMNERPARWIFGAGYGAQYTHETTVRGEALSFTKHYSHLSLLSLIYLYGLPVATLLIGTMFYYLVVNFRYLQNTYYLAMMISFIGALFGASMLVEPTYWFFLGANMYMAKCPRDANVLSA